MKQKIADCFNQAVETYDQSCILQEKTNAYLIEQLKIFQTKFKKAADLGCGTGNSLRHMLNTLECNEIFAVDFAGNLLNKAKEKIGDTRVTFINRDFEKKIIKKNDLDLAYSNLSFQWCKNIPDLLNSISKQLSKGGVLAFSSVLAGTYPELAIKNKFYSERYFLDELKKNKFKMLSYEIENIVLEFDNAISALKSIKHVGAAAKMYSDEVKGLRTLNQLKKRHPKLENKLSYKIGYFIAGKIYEN